MGEAPVAVSKHHEQHVEATLLPDCGHYPSHPVAKLFNPQFLACEHTPDAEFHSLNLVLLVVGEQDIIVGHAVEGGPGLVHGGIIRFNVGDVRAVEQPGVILAVRVGSGGRFKVVGVGKQAGKHQPSLGRRGILAQFFIHRSDYRAGGADRKGIVEQRVRRSHGACAMVVDDMQDTGLCHAIHRLRILAVVSHDHVQASGILQDRRSADTCFLNDIERFADELARHPGLSVDS